MPYTKKQNRMFQAAAHNPAFAKKVGISVAEAKRMAAEGVKRRPVRTIAGGK